MSKLKIELVFSSFEPPTVALKVIEDTVSLFKGNIAIKKVDIWKNQKRMEELGFYGLLPVANLLVLVNDSKDDPLAKKIFSLAHNGKKEELIKVLKNKLE
jgi:hypothetical protein